MLVKIMLVGQSVTMDTTQTNSSMTLVFLVLTYEGSILQLQISSIFHMNCFFLCIIIIIILNSVIGTLHSTNNINIFTLLMVYTHCIKLWMWSWSNIVIDIFPYVMELCSCATYSFSQEMLPHFGDLSCQQRVIVTMIHQELKLSYRGWMQISLVLAYWKEFVMNVLLGMRFKGMIPGDTCQILVKEYVRSSN